MLKNFDLSNLTSYFQTRGFENGFIKLKYINHNEYSKTSHWSTDRAQGGDCHQPFRIFYDIYGLSELSSTPSSRINTILWQPPVTDADKSNCLISASEFIFGVALSFRAPIYYDDKLRGGDRRPAAGGNEWDVY